jgi:hypothetical protein
VNNFERNGHDRGTPLAEHGRFKPRAIYCVVESNS